MRQQHLDRFQAFLLHGCIFQLLLRLAPVQYLVHMTPPDALCPLPHSVVLSFIIFLLVRHRLKLPVLSTRSNSRRSRASTLLRAPVSIRSCRGVSDNPDCCCTMPDSSNSHSFPSAGHLSDAACSKSPVSCSETPDSSSSSIAAAACNIARCWSAHAQPRPGLAAIGAGNADFLGPESPVHVTDAKSDHGCFQKCSSCHSQSSAAADGEAPCGIIVQRPSPSIHLLTSHIAIPSALTPLSRPLDTSDQASSAPRASSASATMGPLTELNDFPSWSQSCRTTPSTEASLTSNTSFSSAAFSSSFLPPSLDQERHSDDVRSRGFHDPAKVQKGEGKSASNFEKNVSFNLPGGLHSSEHPEGRGVSYLRSEPSHTPLDIIELRVLRSKFGELDVGNVGFIGKEEFNKLFAEVLQVPENIPSAEKENLLDFAYALFTRGESQSVRLRDFVTGCVVLCRGSDNERLRYLFQTFDSNRSGTLTITELEAVFQVILSYAYARSVAMGIRVPSSISNPAEAAAEASQLAEKALREHGKCSTGELTCEQFTAWCLDESEVIQYLDALCNDTANGISRLRKQREEKLIQVELAHMGFRTSNKSWNENYNLFEAAADSRDAVNGSCSSTCSQEKGCSSCNSHGHDSDDLYDSPRISSRNHSRSARAESNCSADVDCTPQGSLQNNCGAGDAAGSSSSSRMKTPTRSLIDEETMQISHSASGQLGQFEIDFASLQLTCKIGEGSFAAVWRGKWLDTDVAVKILKSGPPLRFPLSQEASSGSVLLGQSRDCDGTSRFAGSASMLNEEYSVSTAKVAESDRTLDDTLEPELASGNDMASIQESRNFTESVLASTKDRAQFMREIGLLTRLRHPNVLLLMGACTDPRYPLCIISELVNGASLYSYLHGKRKHERNFRTSMKIALDIARGMLYLHSSNPIVLHRDLKSANILVQNFDDPGSVKATIIDFGLSRLDIAKAESRVNGIGGGMCGSLVTMAPEVMRQCPYQPASDVYSFGVILAELMTGRIPFESLNALQLMYAVGVQGKRPELFHGDNIPSSLIELINSCWAQEPSDRPTFAEVVTRLNRVQREFSGSASRSF